MAEYIDRERAKAEVKCIPWCEWNVVWERLDNLPVADVAPVRHGHWIFHDDGYSDYVECSECHDEFTLWSSVTKYCPNCGAKMDEEEEE